MNLRRPLSLFLLALLLVGTSACDHVKTHFSKDDSSKEASSSEESSSSSEADRTSEMEDKAEDIQRQAEDLKTMEGSDQDKIDAYNKMQQDQQELSESSEGGN
jgi:hypothetical protein